MSAWSALPYMRCICDAVQSAERFVEPWTSSPGTSLGGGRGCAPSFRKGPNQFYPGCGRPRVSIMPVYDSDMTWHRHESEWGDTSNRDCTHPYPHLPYMPLRKDLEMLLFAHWAGISEKIMTRLASFRHIQSYHVISYHITEGSLEVKLPTVWTDEKQRWEESENRRKEKRRAEQRRGGERNGEEKKKDHKRQSLRRKKIQVREKVGKSRNTVFLKWFVAPEGRKVGSLERRVQSQLARWEMKNCTPLWHEAHFQVKMYKTPQLRPV